MSTFINGIGHYSPNYTFSQDQALQFAKSFFLADEKRGRVLSRIYSGTGINRRASAVLSENDNFYRADHPPTTQERMLSYAANIQGIATHSCTNALENARWKGAEVTDLITVSCTGFSAPGFDVALIDTLSLNRDVSRTHIGFMGCHAALNAIRIGHAMAEAKPGARVLICAAELCSLHFQYEWLPDNIVANALFADGSAAIAISSLSSRVRIKNSGSCVIPDSKSSMSWRITDHGFQMSLSAVVPEYIRMNLRPWLEKWLSKNETSIADITSWCVHPGGPRILDSVAEALDLNPEALQISRDVLKNHGNMSSPTVLFILEQQLLLCRSGPIALLAFGPGLTVEATLLHCQ